jgi:hypothetical protein
MENMIKAGKTGMGEINLQVRSSAEKDEEPTKQMFNNYFFSCFSFLPC